MNNSKVRPFGIKDKVGYMFGDLANDCTFILSTAILQKFCTDVFGIEGAIIGTIMMLARFVDAITDVTMGRICDRSKVTKYGKFKPWILRFAIPVAVASFLMYNSAIADLHIGVKIAYIIVFYLLWGSFCYTGANIPYGSMASAISADPGDRQSLSTFRSMGGMLAGGVIMVLVPMLAYDKIPVEGSDEVLKILNGNKVMLIAGVLSVVAILCYVVCFFLVQERVIIEPAEDQKRPSVGTMLKNTFKNRALLSIIAASIVMLLAQLTMQNMAAYIYPDYYRDTTAQSASSAFMGVGMLVAAIIAKPLARKFGKAEVSVVSNGFAALVMLIIWIIKPQNVWVFSLMQCLAWLGLGIFSMVSWALITDVIDYSEIKNGVREDGSVYALYSFARKLGQALAAGVSGWLLTAIHYNTDAAKDQVSQTPEVLDGIFTISTLVPAIGFAALALVLWFWYPLHKKQVDENVALLAELHNKED